VSNEGSTPVAPATSQADFHEQGLPPLSRFHQRRHLCAESSLRYTCALRISHRLVRRNRDAWLAIWPISIATPLSSGRSNRVRGPGWSVEVVEYAVTLSSDGTRLQVDQALAQGPEARKGRARETEGCCRRSKARQQPTAEQITQIGCCPLSRRHERAGHCRALAEERQGTNAQSGAHDACFIEHRMCGTVEQSPLVWWPW
jgi:hypothetical protein